MNHKRSIWPELLVESRFFEPEVCKQLVADMLSASADAATVYGRGDLGSVQGNIRRTLRSQVSSETEASVKARLVEYKHHVEQHFGLQLTELEEPQFLRYREGDFFVAHQDGNTGLLRLDTEQRRVSVIIFLSTYSSTADGGDHSGGLLVFTDLQMKHEKFCLPAVSGTLVAFRSETTHEVTPVVHGERLSIAAWFR